MTHDQDPRPDQPPPAGGAGPTPPSAPPPTGGPAVSERPLRDGRTSKRQFYPRWILWGLASLALLWIAWRLTPPAAEGQPQSRLYYYVAGVIILAWGLWTLWRTAAGILGRRYRLTTQRIFVERGILSRATDQTELVRVDDVEVHQTLFQRIFAVGHVRVDSSDASDPLLVLEGLEDPYAWAEDIRQHMRIMRKKSLYVENV